MTTTQTKRERAEKKYKEELRELKASEPFEHIKGFKGVMSHGSRMSAYFEIKESKELAEILNTFKPVNTETELSFTGKDSVFVKSSYRITTKSGVNESGIRIEWQVTDIEIYVTCPIEMIVDFVSLYMREPNDCEYHYFPCMSHKQIMEIQIPAYSFGSGNEQRYFGHDNVCTSPEMIADIIDNWKRSNGGVYKKA